MAIQSKAMYRFSAIMIKIPMTFFRELEKKIIKFILNHKRPRIARAILWKKNKAGSITLPDLTILQNYRSPNNMELAQNRYIDQWKRIENPEINPCAYGQLIYNKRSKNTQWRKIVSSTSNIGKNWATTWKTVALEHSLTQYTKINSKWLKDLKVRSEIIK